MIRNVADWMCNVTYHGSAKDKLHFLDFYTEGIFLDKKAKLDIIKSWYKETASVFCFCLFNPNQCDVWKACQVGGAPGAPYLSQLFMVRFSKFFFLVKACENRHWFLLHRRPPIFHRLAARCRRSGEGQSWQYFHVKNQILQFLSYIYVIYLKRMHFSCRIQIQTKKVWFIIEKFEKIPIFPILGQKRGWPGIFDSWFLKNFYDKFKNGFARSCKKVWT